jgi:hypothetical protein
MLKGRSATVWAFAIGNAVLALIVLLALFRDLGARSSIAIVPSLLVAALLLASSFGLLRRTPWSLLALRASAWVGLAIGACALAALAISAFQVSPHDDIGESSALAPLLMLALLLPYLILYPSAQLLWLHQRRRRFAKPH